MRVINIIIVTFILASFLPLLFIHALCLQSTRDIQDQTRASEVVIKALAMNVWLERDGLFSGHFAIMTVYKGAKIIKDMLHIAGSDLFNISDKRINVTGFQNNNSGNENSACGITLTVGTYFVLFANKKNGRIITKDEQGGLVEWSDDNERSVWFGLGWGDWSDWSACNVSCDTGLQYRHRKCIKCSQGHNKEMRKCNDFPCNGVMELVAPSDNMRTIEGKLKNLQKGFTLPNHKKFPNKFSILVSLRILPKVDFGTVLHLTSTSKSIRSIVLEISGPDLLRVSFNTPQSNRSVLIASVLADGITHQLGLGFQGDEVIAYLDCRWVTTEILMPNSFAPSEEYDTNIFEESLTVDLIQLLIVPDETAVSDQCTIFRIAELDTELIKPKIRDKSYKSNSGLSNGF
ncbi:uncharacterized protein LOC126906631 [Daktulosphaira vitifoliae]|uniref:uncharacterized protein LOC126906631 n=1 Tax=Daktulosphaira vitifoliae TaxID=58002 RepID=UPI0021AAB634|nr:uncharacterized protein LOC126906631 [Daktulosphaira vitifoliae]